MKVKVDKTLAASIVLHLVVIGWGLVTFSTRAFVMPEEDTVAVDVIDANQLSKAMSGQKDGKKDNPKPLVEKVAEAKPVDDAVGKIEDKKPPVVTDTAPPPTPKVEEKPEEKKPDPPKKVENKPKEEPKPVENKPDPVKPDPIAEAIKKEEKKPPPKPVQQAAKPPPEQKPKERTFDRSKIAELLDKRDPTRAAATGDTLNSNASLGTSKGKAADNSATWGAMFKQQVERCWKKPYGGIEAQQTEVSFAIKLKRDGTLEGMPVPEGAPGTPYLRVYQESALRAIIECQPYNLPAAFFDEWKYFAPVFTERKT
ncbi:membrane protein TolA [Bradyrhizobium sp. LTSPM299]|uniref:cell envelope integrity protein TolA n=1 Tax=Bradyrhizobium sp. LTSPM299 TaxID=1619233 RepID=UPI0005CA3663|nr:cell envelope integrity protein TolA [Bradyrhizobium sp. LTSPM299]KJC57867.1 membrane protein TolA [Bradyrhizobium sp. LTSPM299]